MAKLSAGILLYRRRPAGLEVFLVHPGGPFWAKKDEGAWSIPKGEYESDEEPLAAALREFEEETGIRLAGDNVTPLGNIQQKSGKIVTAWALEGDCIADPIVSNLFSMEWPPKSGKIQQFPEVDRAQWFPLAEAHTKLIEPQREFLRRLSCIDI